MTGEKFGDLSILERDLRAIITIQPGNADALNALGYTLTDRTDRHEEALALIERALAINPSEAAFIDSLGWALYRLENFTESVAHLRKALELFPNDEVAAHLGEVLWVMGERLEANEVWRKALELAPQSEILKKIIQQFTTQ
jgi:tetratricopeptide (TPR) repeat protein